MEHGLHWCFAERSKFENCVSSTWTGWDHWGNRCGKRDKKLRMNPVWISSLRAEGKKRQREPSKRTQGAVVRKVRREPRQYNVMETKVRDGFACNIRFFKRSSRVWGEIKASDLMVRTSFSPFTLIQVNQNYHHQALNSGMSTVVISDWKTLKKWYNFTFFIQQTFTELYYMAGIITRCDLSGTNICYNVFFY